MYVCAVVGLHLKAQASSLKPFNFPTPASPTGTLRRKPAILAYAPARMLTIPTTIVKQMQDHALACYPKECCGILFAKNGSDAAIRCVPLENMADKLHALDPVENPRDGRDWFAPNEAKLARHVREAEAQGERWLALFHSHIDCGAYFSADDKRYAAPDGQAVYPELYQTVIETHAHGVIEARTFRWNGNDFAQVAVHPDFARSRT